jgi:hypothetical protein
VPFSDCYGAKPLNLDTILHTPLGDAVPYVTNMLRAQLVPMLHGSPAIGKSAIMALVAKTLNLFLIDARFAGFDPTDLTGFPAIDHAAGISRYYPMETFPLDDWKIPEGYSGWLVFCDELTSAPPAVQVASYKLFLDRQVGQRKLHPQVYLAGAGNLESDGAVVNPMSTALISRLGHIVVTQDFEFFMTWAEKGGLPPLMCSWLRYMPDSFYTFNPEEPDQPYASPRTLDFVGQYLAVVGGDPRKHLVPMAGFINLKPAQDLITFTNVWAKLPKKAEVLANPKTAECPGYDNPGALHAICGAVGDWLAVDNVKDLMPYIERIEPDFQAVTLRNAVRRKPDLMSTPEIQKWIQSNASVLL